MTEIEYKIMMTEIEYKIMMTESPAPAEQLEEEFGKEGWILQVILYWEGNLFYHFIRPKITEEGNNIRRK